MKKNISKKKLFGFTFIEVMVSLFVLISGIALFLQVFPLGWSAERSSQMKTQAIFLAQQKMEDLLTLSYQDVPLGTATEPVLTDPFGLFSRSTVVSYLNSDLEESAVDVGLKRIKVEVSWQAALDLSGKKVQLITLLTDK